MLDKQKFYLTQLASECVELAHEITKALQFGLDDVNPKTQEKNLDAIVREYHDVIGSMMALEFEGIIQRQAYPEAFKKTLVDRIEKTGKMFEYSQNTKEGHK